MSEPTNAKPPFLRRVRIRNFKSIAYCDVTLEPLTILVGRNRTGKSNFIEALAFLRDCVDTNLDRAIRDHGGWDRIYRKDAGGEPMEIGLEWGEDEETAEYDFSSTPSPTSSPVTKKEVVNINQKGVSVKYCGRPSLCIKHSLNQEANSISYSGEGDYDEVKGINRVEGLRRNIGFVSIYKDTNHILRLQINRSYIITWRMI